MKLPYFADPANLVVEEEPQPDDPMLPDDMTAKQALELEMRGRIKLTPSQFRTAKELLPYEQPKLTAVAIGHMDGNSFAQALERAIERSKQPPTSSFSTTTASRQRIEGQLSDAKAQPSLASP